MLSAFVYPGAGQFLQKRWIAGAVYSLLFTVFSVLLLVEVVRPMFHNVTAAMDWAASQQSNEPFENISFSKVLVTFVAMGIVYIVNVVDIQHATRKKSQPPPLPPTA